MMAEKKPVIVQVFPSLEDGGGIARGALEVARALVQAGAQPVLLSKGTLSAADKALGIWHIPCDMAKTFSPWRFLKQVCFLRKILKATRADLVHARSRHPAWLAFFACHAGRHPANRIPWLATWHGKYQTRFCSPRYFYTKGLLLGDKVIAVSLETGKRILSHYKMDRSKVEIIPRGADPALFFPASVSEARKKALIEKWHLSAHRKLIFAPGRLTPWKGQDILLEALAILLKTHSDWQCVFAGAATRKEYQQALLRKVQALGLGEKVSFQAPLADMPAAYALAEVTVLPVLAPEPFGRIAAEAQMSQCPVIASSIGGYVETLSESPSGVLVPPGDANALAAALGEALDKPPALRETQVKKGRVFCRRLFAMNDYLAKTLSVYDGLLQSDLQKAFQKVQATLAENTERRDDA